MKRLLTIIGNSLLVLGAVYCSLGAVISAFSFDVDSWTLIIILLVAAMATSALTYFQRAKGLLFLIPPTLIFFIWKLTEIAEEARWVVFTITTEYNKWLFLPVLFSGSGVYEYDQTVFFAAAGIILSFVLSAAICLRRSTYLTIVITAPILFLTFVLVSHPSDAMYLFGMLAVYLTMLISNSIFPDDFRKRDLAIFPALSLALILMGATYYVASPESYDREDYVASLDNRIRQTASRMGVTRVKSGVGWPVGGGGTDGEWRFNTNTVGISEAGTRTITDQSILEITADSAGVFYLRGYSMQSFDGNSWKVNSESLPHLRNESARILPMFIAHMYSITFPEDAPTIVTMTIDKTGDVSRDLTYTPYYSYPSEWQRVQNTFDFYYVEGSLLRLLNELPPDSFDYFSMDYYNELVRRRNAYTQIDDDTAYGLRQIAVEAGIDETADREIVAEQVAEYISSVGRYTLSPFVIPEHEDFALYFLRVSRQGYCIHYATAATLMLRALDIPARFTSGFVATVSLSQVGNTVVLTDRNAHAWVEVYYDDVGWLPLEVTPPASGTGSADGRPYFDIGTNNPRTDLSDGPDLESDWWEEYDFDASTPSGPYSGTDADRQAHGQLRISKEAAGIILCIAFASCILSLILRRIIAGNLRKKRFAMADTNASVIHAWRYISRLLRKERPPDEIEGLALKARFSQHRISGEERSMVVAYAGKLPGEVYAQHSPFRRIWIKLVRGL